MSYSCNLDTFALSTDTLAFQSMAVVDGVPVYFDEQGAYVLDADDDDGASFEAWIDPGWTDGAGLVPPGVPTEFQKQLDAVYLTGMASEALNVSLRGQEDEALETAEFFGRAGSLDAPAVARIVPPKGLRSVLWRFRIGGEARGAWRLAGLRVVFKNLTRRV